MGVHVRVVGVVDVVGGHQVDPQLPAQAQKSLVHHLLGRNPVILKLQEEIALSKNFLIPKGRLPGLVVEAPLQVSGHLPRQAGAQGDDPLVVLLQNLIVHPGPVVESVHKALETIFIRLW